MTPDTIALVQGSFRKVAPIADIAANIFYDRLFTTHPALRSLFPEDMSEQKGKLVQMLGIAVGGLTRPEEIIPAVEALGRRHTGYGVEAAHYDAVGAALIHTLRTGLGNDFTPEVEAAWVETFTLLSGVMIAGQEKAAA